MNVFEERINRFVRTSSRKTLPLDANGTIDNHPKLVTTLTALRQMETRSIRRIAELMNDANEKFLVRWIIANRETHLGFPRDVGFHPFMFDLDGTKFFRQERHLERQNAFNKRESSSRSIGEVMIKEADL